MKSSSQSFLTTFVRPTPSVRVMSAMTHVNRWLNFKGIPLLKWIPFIGRIPGIRGLCDITKIEFDAEEEKSLKALFDNQSVVFIGPNHPEFYTDWMMDKELAARVSPEMAFMATHEVVNGLGPKMQKFWLKNNLTAQIPGTGNQGAKDYLTESALAGKGALLHPEGHVGWHADKVAPLFPGIFDMAHQAYLSCKGAKPVYVVPVVWKLYFNKNVEAQLHNEIAVIEQNIGSVTDRGTDLDQRLRACFTDVMLKIADEHHIILNFRNIVHFHEALTRELAYRLAAKLKYIVKDDTATAAKMMGRIIRTRQSEDLGESASDANSRTEFKKIKMLHKQLTSLLEFDFTYYAGTHLTQEQIAEILQKMRAQFCTQGWRNMVHKFIPIPAGPRTARMSVGAPIHVNELASFMPDTEELRDSVMSALKYRLQEKLDDINAEIDNSRIKYPNPFNVAYDHLRKAKNVP